MARRNQPSHAFRVREAHRRSLTWHFAALCIGLVGLSAANRMLTPETFWAHWAALGWGIAFFAHLAHFAHGTLASMGAFRKKRDSEPGEAQLPSAPGRSHPER